MTLTRHTYVNVSLQQKKNNSTCKIFTFTFRKVCKTEIKLRNFYLQSCNKKMSYMSLLKFVSTSLTLRTYSPFSILKC